MDVVDVFRVANLLALVSWAALLASLLRPTARWSERIRQSGLVPALLAAAYLILFSLAVAGQGFPDFSSVTGLRRLFASDQALVAGWLHYLCFDLLIGGAIARAGLAAGTPRSKLIPILLLTFLAGPIGFLLFLLVRRSIPSTHQETPAWQPSF